MELVKGFDAFFVDEIEAAEERLKLELSPHAKLYLIHLLKHLSESRDFFFSDVVQEKPLGIVLMEALHKNIFERTRDLKAVGDLSLIFSGLYPEFLTRRMVDIDYFIEIGRRSYRLLSDTYGPYRTKQELYRLYSVLFAEFLRLIDVLTEISGELHFMDEADIVKALARWRRTGLKRYHDILERHGVFPISSQGPEEDGPW
jgi:hypothetical protein